ncbi:ubiquinol-cytochrome-c reductase complex assembly factor 1 isoform X3 [Cynara cardunculus var. scolymus]|nr:ubiquinol-cytochrome-c reductase complex assembly factor 1 isoform X3 [Cynara cardunculus var. scolymus]XP_024985000.1 ubiquinol-cytochrome-c reductase complex assembly factor 1 isoform X3 [Cynara cardunculus var. scolymus]
MFRAKPRSLALPPGSSKRINEPNYEGIRRFILRLMLFYSKQSTSIRAANVIYRRVISQVDKPSVYDVLCLEKTFRTTFSMLMLYMWLCLRRLKVEGKEGVELGQYVYEIYNHDLEMRVSKAGVNLLLSKWMRELEKVFYGNIVAYDTAMLPEAKPDELQNAIWKNVFSDDGSPTYDATALPAVLAFSRYVRRECTCLSLTDKESMFSGNFMFTPLENPNV